MEARLIPQRQTSVVNEVHVVVVVVHPVCVNAKYKIKAEYMPHLVVEQTSPLALARSELASAVYSLPVPPCRQTVPVSPVKDVPLLVVVPAVNFGLLWACIMMVLFYWQVQHKSDMGFVTTTCGVSFFQS